MHQEGLRLIDVDCFPADIFAYSACRKRVLDPYCVSCSAGATSRVVTRVSVQPFYFAATDFSPAVSHKTITSPTQLADLCDRLRHADRIGIDTEFVSEDTF